ncbi:alcohol dehydrogenase catalytic domain-containing protein [Phytoactinopolyspora endophytica]|uniref:alcohol dehydrogenase catalytic domain-containing protein n=1 Tax=Phytoactinopolyspora endophytica TaxID=1642495 RepID=UPI00101C3A2C|nr:alcohol dehydrogenase catalytic domain-containing protein [Phytoactinopolyspora endophytica]
MQTAGAEVQLDVSIAVFDDGAITVERVDLPDRSAGEIDVAISAAAICGSDLHTVLGHRSAPARTALGHEAVGRVADLDDGTTDFRGTPLRRGDRVVFSMLSECGSCDRCRAGLTMKCRSLLKYGHESVTTPPHATGTLAEQVRLLPSVPVLRVPDDVADVQVVSAGCAVATAAAVVAAAGTPPPGTRILVLGVGAVGAYCAAMFATLGCAVQVRDPSPERLALAAQLGAQPADSDGEPFSVVVEASGSSSAVLEALNAADVGGHVVAAGSVSLGSSTVTIDPALLVTRRLRVTGLHNYTAENFRWGVDWLVAHGRHLGLERLVSPPFPLSAVDEAFQLMKDGRYPRVLVRPDGHGDPA